MIRILRWIKIGVWYGSKGTNRIPTKKSRDTRSNRDSISKRKKRSKRVGGSTTVWNNQLTLGLTTKTDQRVSGRGGEGLLANGMGGTSTLRLGVAAVTRQIQVYGDGVAAVWLWWRQRLLVLGRDRGRWSGRCGRCGGHHGWHASDAQHTEGLLQLLVSFHGVDVLLLQVSLVHQHRRLLLVPHLRIKGH